MVIKNIQTKFLFGMIFLFLILISFGFVFAGHTITTSTGTTSYNINEDVGFIYNITVNNTDTGLVPNITQVNITIPSSFSFLVNSNGTDSSYRAFINTSTVLSWNNSNGLVNGSLWNSFWFNVTATNPGNYNITVTTVNATGSYSSNINVTVNDTTSPYSIDFASSTPAAGSNLSQTNIPINISVNDSYSNIGIIRIYLFNSTRLINNTNVSAVGGMNATGFINFTGLSNGIYYVNATANDSVGNQNLTGPTRTFTLDTSVPVITLISPTNENTTITPGNVNFIFSVSDSFASNCSLILNGAKINFNSSVNISGGNNVFTNASYVVYNTWNVNCTDSSNNKANSSTWSYTLVNFQFNGTVRDNNANAVNNTLVNVTVSAMGNQGLSTVGYFATASNLSGWFNVTLPALGSLMYKPVIRHTNVTTNAVDFVGPSIPDFPYAEFSQLNSINFYLKQAGTINITAINVSSDRITFNYQVKDTKLGYPIAYDFTTPVNEALIYVPTDRNYSVMIYPQQSLPVSFNWNNFSSSSSYSFGVNSSYNATTRTLIKQFNTTNSLIRLTGYINATGVSDLFNLSLSGWDEFKVVALLLEPGNMVYMQYGVLPYNMSAWRPGSQSDVYNLTTGYYNITVPGPAETQTILLFATARNGTRYYGGFKNVSIGYSTATNLSYDFSNNSMLPMLGNPANLSLNLPTSQGTINVTYVKQTFNILNATNGTFSGTAHVEAKVDYSNYGAMEFTFMQDIAQGSGNFSIPLLNISGGVKEFNVFVAQGAPKRLSKTASQIISNNNITISSFRPSDIDGALANSQITIAMYKSNSSCDVPNPASSCLVTSSSDLATFNPLSAVIGGGAISFRMGTSTGILIHYVNVDMLASGPPDGLFENDAGTSESSSSFSNVMKFGSAGPTMYDYVLVSMPYVEGSNSTTGLNENTEVNLSIPTFYGQNANGDMDWTTPIWSSSNGTNATSFAGNYSHYSAYQSDWQVLMQSKNCTQTVTTLSATTPCYIDTTNNRIWIRLPHFSGTAPTVAGGIVTATTASSSSSGSGGGSTALSYWINTQSLSDSQFTLGFTKEFLPKYRVTFKVDKISHAVGLISLSSTTATINISSTPQQVTLSVGEEKKFDVDDDKYYDVYVKLNSIANNKASITIKSINEKIPETAVDSGAKTTAAETNQKTDEAAGKQVANTANSLSWLWLIIIIILAAVIIAVIVIILKKGSKKDRYINFKRGH